MNVFYNAKLFYIVHTESGLVVGPVGNSSSNKTKLELQTNSGSKHQMFTILADGSMMGQYSGLVLDAQASLADGNDFWLYSNIGKDYTQWHLDSKHGYMVSPSTDLVMSFEHDAAVGNTI